MKILYVIAGMFLLVPATVRGSEAARYPRSGLLVDPAELAEEEARDNFTILDARKREEYDTEHVPGALWVDVSAWSEALGDGRDSEAWSVRIGELGISHKSKIVVYDDNRSRDSARVWWLLRYWGAGDVRLLNGGWKGWKAADLPVSSEEPQVERATFKATAATERLMTAQEVLDILKSGAIQIVDARSEAEFCGIDKQKNKVGGAIPGAKHLEWDDLIDSKTDRFKDADELRRLFAEAKIELDRPAVSHCQSGGRASVMAFALELMGVRDVRNYYRGWSEWGNEEGLPVMVPEEQKRKAEDTAE